MDRDAPDVRRKWTIARQDVVANETSDEPRFQNPVKIGLVLLLVATAVAVIQYKIPTIMIPLMEIFAIDASLASWLMSVFLLVGIFVALPIGGLAARFGFKRMILVALLLALAGAAIGIASGFIGNGFLLVASRAIEGVSFTVVTACGPIGVNQCVRPERIGTAMGLFGNWGTCGSTISSFIVPTIFAALGFEWVWIVVAGITILAGVLLIIFVKDPKLATESEECQECQGDVCQGDVSLDTPRACQVIRLPDTPDTPGIRRGFLRQYREIFNRDTVLYLLGFVTFNMMLLALLSYLPSILQVKGFEATFSGLVTSSPLLLSMISVPLFGVISDKLGRTKPLLVGMMALFGPCVCLMYLFTNALLWVGAAVLGLVALGSVGLFLVGWSKVLPRPELIPVGMGVMIFFQCIGQFLGTSTIQMLLGPNFDNTLLAGSIIVLLGLIGSGMLFISRFE
jgi:MFS family permease